jgi:hypothetical protein
MGVHGQPLQGQLRALLRRMTTMMAPLLGQVLAQPVALAPRRAQLPLLRQRHQRARHQSLPTAPLLQAMRHLWLPLCEVHGCQAGDIPTASGSVQYCTQPYVLPILSATSSASHALLIYVSSM